MKHASILVLTCGLLLSTAFGQVNPNLEAGLKPYGSYEGGNIDVVNLQNLNLSMQVPLIRIPQRGSVPVAYGFVFDAKGWWVKETCNQISCTDKWQPPTLFNGGPTHQVGVRIKQMYTLPTVQTVLNQQLTYSYTAYDWDGAAHQMFQRTSTGGGEAAVDGSGIASDGSLTVQNPTWVRTRDGSKHTISTSLQDEDTNGNYISYASTSTDTMGRSLSFTSGTPDASGCAGPLTVTSKVATNYPGLNGGNLQIQFCYVSLALSTNFQALSVNTSDPILEYTGTATNVVQSIAICNRPSGSCAGTEWAGAPKWVFAYDSYGDVTQVTLPTGGTVSYTWQEIYLCGQGLTPVSMGVATRVLNDGTGPQTYTYFGNPEGPTTVIDPLGNYVVHSYSRIGISSCSSYETQTDWYQFGGTKVKTVTTAYSSGWTSRLPDGTFVAYNVFPTSVTTTWPNGQVSSVQKTYDSSLTVTPPTGGSISASYGKVTQQKEYDYGQGASGPLLRQTNYSYLALSNSSYMSANLLDLISSQTVYDGSGHKYAYTSYGYDETTLASSGITTQHDGTVPNPGVRGNRTSVKNCAFAPPGQGGACGGGTQLTTTTVYYDTGMPNTVTDPGGHTTTYLYSGTYVGAYQTQTTFPNTGVAHTISGTYDFNLGVLTSFTDQNSQVSNYTYDGLGRILTASFPDGGQITLIHTDTPLAVNVERTDKIDASRTTDLFVAFDGLGRLKRKITANGESTPWDQVDTCYDGAGRVSFTSYPYQGSGLGAAQVCSGAGDSFAYDALGRTTSVTHSDNSVISTSYTGAATSVMDEGNGTSHVQRVSQVDGLGRLISVCEVTSTTLLGTTPTPAACGQAISATGFLTSYAYDALGNLTSVTQGGLAGRSFVYDSLSRLTSATNPESGTTTYSYNSDSLLYQRTRPAPNQGLSTVTETTTYTYDALHRQTGQTYNPNAPGTPTVTIAYDQSSAFGVTLTYPTGRKTSEFTTNLSGNLSGAVYSYDQMGRIVNNSQCTPQNCATSVFPITYTYDLAGDPLTATNGMGTTLTYAYNAAPRLTSITSSLSDAQHPGTLYSAAHYNAAGALTSAGLGNGLNETRAYDGRLRLNSIAVGPSGSIYSVTIPTTGGYASNSDILAANDSVNGNWTYTYDDFNRLKSSTQSGGSAYTYDYDRFGNRWHQNGPQSSQLSFDATNHIASGNGVTYDAAGNVTNDGSHTYYYDNENRITAVDGTAAAYVYDAGGQRIRKTTGSSSVDYLYDLGAHVISEVSAVGSWNRGEVFGGDRHVATYSGGTGGSTLFSHTDWLGTERARSSASGTLSESFTSLPFGDGLSSSGSSPLHFTGKERDNESGLDYFGARYYANNPGRFTSVDPHSPISDANNPKKFRSQLVDPQKWDQYSYVTGNPLKYVDPNGLDKFLVVYVQQPVPGTSTVWTREGMGANPGHASIGLKDTDAHTETKAGFYPAKTVTPMNPSVQGEVKDDSNHSWNVKKEYKITDDQYDAAMKSVNSDKKTPPQYDLNNNNCTDWVEQKAAAAGVTIPDTKGSWPGGGGSNPGQLGEELRKQGAQNNPDANSSGNKDSSSSTKEKKE